MKQSEIMAMPAGRDMDARIQESFFESAVYWEDVTDRDFMPYRRATYSKGTLLGSGKTEWAEAEIPRHSTGVAAAMLVWEELRRRCSANDGYEDRLFDALVTLYGDPGKPQDILSMASMRWFFAGADIPLTLCRLALMLAAEEKESINVA